MIANVLQDPCVEKTNIVLLVLILYSALNNKLKNIILRRKLYAEKP